MHPAVWTDDDDKINNNKEAPLFKYALEYANRRFQARQEGLNLDDTYYTGLY